MDLNRLYLDMAAKPKSKKVTTKKTVKTVSGVNKQVSGGNFIEKIFPKVSDMTTAKSLVKQVAILYLVLALVMVSLGILVSRLAFYDAVILLTLSVLLYKLQAKWVAIAMVIYSGLSFLGTVTASFMGPMPAVFNILLSGFVLYMSIKGWQAAAYLVSSKK